MQNEMMMKKTVFLGVAAMAGMLLSAPVRPYEFEWANRTKDDFPPVLPLVDAAGWRVVATNAVASFTRSEERALFGDGVARLTFRATGPNASLRLVPPEPVALPDGFDTMGIWVYVPGEERWDPVKGLATTKIRGCADIIDSEGKTFPFVLGRIALHLEWFLSRRRLAPADIDRVKKGAKFASFSFWGFTNTEDRSIDLTSFTAFRDPLKPLAFKPRAKRGVQLFPDEPQGINTGEGRLPFPNRPETVLPPCAGEDPRLEFRFPADSLRWDDLAFRWDGGEWIPLAVGGGLFPAAKNARITFKRIGNSVVADIVAPEGDVEEARFGVVGAKGEAERILVPYWNYRPRNRWERPAVIRLASGGTPLFVSATPDWTQSAASEPFCEKAPAVLSAHGGMRYTPKTDGLRNGCFERFIWTVSPDFAATLPTIPNPVSPWKHVTGKNLWRPHGASKDRASDVAYWREVRSRGLKHIVVNDHESEWRDGNESFTFRLRPAPKKGGDKGQFDYARTMIDELGFFYGPYNNFTDYAPVNGFWDPDNVSRLPDGNFKYAWNRCYGPKPLYAVEMCEKLAPQLEKKFGFNTAYCDVHTCETPWKRTDYDVRAPGAGTFAQTFYCYGEIMLLQKKAWNGPVYSEGSMHWMYCGLADGNYAQDQEYNLADNPWLVDFDLLRMHPLCCNFGMGSRSMFYPKGAGGMDEDVQHDRFICATLAFGHSGFLPYGERQMVRGYFLVQALAARYTQADVTSIRYVDAEGRLLDTSAALAGGAWKRSQLVVRYSDGTWVAANGSKTEEMPASADGAYPALPPNGFFGRSGDGQVEVFSARRGGKLKEYAHAPEYRYDLGDDGVQKIEFPTFDPVAFRTPPPENRPECWFALKGGCLDSAALTRELAALKAGGFGGIQSMQFGGKNYSVPNNVPYLSPGWHDFMRLMGNECQRLGLSYTMLACPGWSMFGGPWVPADRQMRELVFASASGTGCVRVQRPAKADDRPGRDYRDIRLMAFPTPRGADEPLPAPTAAHGTRAAPFKTIPHAWAAYNGRPHAAPPPFTDADSDAAWLKVFSDAAVPIDFPAPGHETCTVTYPRAVTVRTLEIPSPQMMDHMWCYEPDVTVALEAEAADRSWREIGRWKLPPSCWQDSHPLSLACDETTATRFRFSFIHSHPARLHYVRLLASARLTDYEGRAGHALRGIVRNQPAWRTDSAAFVNASKIIFPKAEADASGALAVALPEGRWTVLRVGSVASLIRNHPAPADATGWECDKLSAAGADAHWDGFIEPLVKKGGALENGRLKGLLLDSWECEAQSWTEGLDAAFRTARGYPLDTWYPALAGYVVGSRAQTEKFLLDWRRLLSDRVRDEFFGRIAERAHAHGIRLSIETAGGDVYPGDLMDYWRKADVPMCEFWYPRTGYFVGSLEYKPVRPCVSAAHVYGKPGVAAESLTETTDRSAETPADWIPVLNAYLARGVTRIVFNGFTHNLKEARTGHDGIDFEAHPEWWPPLTAYLARCRYALELGTSERDVLLHLGDDLDHKPPQDLAFPEGYDYDYVNADALRSRLVERDGVWRSPDGTTWRLLVNRDTPKEKIAAELAKRKVAPDLLFARKSGDDKLLWIHRKLAKSDIYFVCADYGRPLAGDVSVRASGAKVFVADPMTGETKPLAFERTAEGRTSFRLDLPVGAARFVIVCTEG